MCLVRLPFPAPAQPWMWPARPNIIAFETPIFKDWDMNGF
jgi:hypothetical protein